MQLDTVRQPADEEAPAWSKPEEEDWRADDASSDGELQLEDQQGKPLVPSLKEVRRFLSKHRVDTSDCLEREEWVALYLKVKAQSRASRCDFAP